MAQNAPDFDVLSITTGISPNVSCCAGFSDAGMTMLPCAVAAASEKRQGRKSREVGHRRCRGRYGDLATGSISSGGYDPAVEDAGLIDAAFLGHSRRQLFANAVMAASRRDELCDQFNSAGNRGKGNGVNVSNGSSQSARKNTASVSAELIANSTQAL
jgi:hypothetical protein